ncbi:MAG: Ldh family oxidoreductase [Anaerolineae bacterium]|nr:Ldh family oxidoreductase [Anaerolineae bacterium]
MTTYRRVEEKELFRFAQQVLEAAGTSPENAAIMAEHLVQAELHGLGSHGVSRLLGIYAARLRAGGMNPQPNIRAVRQVKSGAVVDGDHGSGMVVGRYAMDLAIKLAQEHGSGWVAVRNSSHYGAAFLFARQAIAQGMIGFSTTSSVALVAPFGGRKRALGTNPICIAVPGGERGNIILDMATSVVARGKIQLAALEGREIPLGWAVDEEGRPTTDPVAASKGCLLPVGGPKGYGLALIVEVFSALLSGAAFGSQIGSLFADLDKPQNMGHFFGALDISIFAPLDEFRARMDRLVEYIKSVPTAEGFDEILLPGEPEVRKATRYREEGIPIAEDVIKKLDELAKEYQVSPLQSK